MRRIGSDRPLLESWGQFRRRLPADAIALLERIGDRGGVGRERPENLLCAETGDVTRQRRMINSRIRMSPPGFPFQNMGHAMIPVGNAGPVQMGEDDESNLLLEG